ncbi:hypothetical protein [Riemerella columbina]|uniref:hypothetical protein n=1 Tax=Riemerella columbina TaxID=103810 RepID=UPI00266F9941|nr:hypothetical protein [Riemerella columbina]WKS95894.1 hypothetical protein NYR17_03950 [Riemerella columbina]
MKHYTQFLKERTPRLIQLGKMSRTLSHDIEETERKLKALKQQREEIESEIFSNVFHLYGRGTSEVIETAQQRADEYNHNRVMNYPQYEDNERRND